MDRELREAGRRAGDEPEGRARLVVERLRAGDLTQEAVELAARLGDPAAALALDGRVGPDRTPGSGWHDEVRLALARRLLSGPDAPAPGATAVVLRGPPGTNDGRRFLPPTVDEIRASIGGAALWQVEALYGEGEVVLILGAPTAMFDGLADFWAEAGLRHVDVGFVLYDVQSRLKLARRVLREPEAAVRRLDDPLDQAACGQHGFATEEAVGTLRRLMWPGPAVRGLRLVEEWNEVTDLVETREGLFLAHWSTSA